MDEKAEAKAESLPNAWIYRHDWSSESESSDDGLSRCSSRRAHSSPDRLERCLEDIRTSKEGSSPTITSYTKVTQDIVVDLTQTTRPTLIKYGKEFDKKLPLPGAFEENSTVKTEESQESQKKKDHSRSSRAETPVIQVNNENAEDSLHSPQPQRYLRPSVTAADHIPPAFPLYDNHSSVTALEPTQYFPDVPPSLNSSQNASDTIDRLPGFKSLAKQITRKSREIKPMYRRFEEIRHRILLHLQHELSELENGLQRLDKDIQTATKALKQPQGESLRQITAISIPPIYELHDVHFMKHRRTLLLGRIFEKVQQYDQALSSFESQATNLGIPDDTQLKEYTRFVSSIKDVTAVERRFLHRRPDLGTTRSITHNWNGGLSAVDLRNGIMIGVFLWIMSTAGVFRLLVLVFMGCMGYKFLGARIS